MPMNRSLYPPDWNEISLRIRERAGFRCEWCGAIGGEAHPVTGSPTLLSVHHIGVDWPDGSPGSPHDKSDCRAENLVCLCARCHLAAEWRIMRDDQRAAQLDAGQLELWPDE